MSTQVKIQTVNPHEVEYKLRKANWGYTNTQSRSDDVGFANVGVFPILYLYVIQERQVPDLDAMLHHLMHFCEPHYRQDKRAHTRAKKLVQDFCRDLHTFGLLSHTPDIASVSYQKGMDLRYNVDYLARLLSSLVDSYHIGSEEIGVQASMMHPKRWDRLGDSFLALKSHRRSNRTQVKNWDGPLYWLTNKDRPYAKSIGGVWLFGEAHIHDLMDEIKGDFNENGKQSVAIKQQALF